MVLPASELWGLNIALGGLIASAISLRSESLKNDYPWIHYSLYLTGIVLGIVVAYIIYSTQVDSQSADRWRFLAEFLLMAGLIVLSLLALKTKDVVIEVYKRASKQVTFA